MTGLERMRAALAGQSADVCPAAPIFWGAEYVWKLTGRTLLDQLYGTPPAPYHAARALADAHAADWLLLTVDDGNGWLEGKRVTWRGDDALIEDPATGKRYEFVASGRVLRDLDATPKAMAGKRAQAWTEDELRARLRAPFPAPSEEARAALRALAQDYGERLFLCACQISPFVDTCYRLGVHDAMLAMGESPTLFHTGAELSLQAQQAWLAGLRDCGLHGVLIAESYASCDMVSPRQYQEFAFPYQKAMVDFIHSLGLYAVMFSTGNVLPLLEQMAELGADGLVVEEARKAAPMEIGEVRRRYGAGRCLFGNVSSEDLLARGDLPGIRREVERQINAAGQNGAFVISNGASPVCDATPPDAVNTLIEAAHAWRYER